MWLLPYAYKEEKSPHYEDLMKVAEAATFALKSVRQTNYTYGVSREEYYPAHGVSVDWAHEKLGIKFTYILELNPTYGVGGAFLLPVDEIKPTLEETWAGIVEMTRSITNLSSTSEDISSSSTSVWNLLLWIFNSFLAFINIA